MYYKIIKDNYVIDVCNSWAKLNKRGNLVMCKYDEAQFMLGREPERIPYRVEWMMPLPDYMKGIETAESILITEEEYERLFNILYNNDYPEHVEDIIIEDEIETSEEETPPESPSQTMSYSELIKQVQELTNYCDALAQQNRLLEDCILEMSKILYE